MVGPCVTGTPLSSRLHRRRHRHSAVVQTAPSMSSSGDDRPRLAVVMKPSGVTVVRLADVIRTWTMFHLVSSSGRRLESLLWGQPQWYGRMVVVGKRLSSLVTACRRRQPPVVVSNRLSSSETACRRRQSPVVVGSSSVVRIGPKGQYPASSGQAGGQNEIKMLTVETF